MDSFSSIPASSLACTRIKGPGLLFSWHFSRLRLDLKADHFEAKWFGWLHARPQISLLALTSHQGDRGGGGSPSRARSLHTLCPTLATVQSSWLLRVGGCSPHTGLGPDAAPPLQTPPHIPADLVAPREAPLPPVCPPFPGSATPTSLAGGPLRLTRVRLKFFPSHPGKGREWLLGSPWASSDPPFSFLGAGFQGHQGAARPPPSEKPACDEREPISSRSHQERVNRDSCGLCHTHSDFSHSSPIRTWLISFAHCTTVGGKGHFGILFFFLVLSKSQNYV